jgi:TrmH family RNA methyltransferase
MYQFPGAASRHSRGFDRFSGRIYNTFMITSASNPQIKQLRLWQKKSSERVKDGIFLAESPKLVLEAPTELIRSVYVSESFENEADPKSPKGLCQEHLRKNGIPYEILPDSLFGTVSDEVTPQGILAVLNRPHYEEEALLSGSAPLLVLCENLQDPGNLGTILRTGEGAGITAVILSKGSVDPFHTKVVRATMGSIFRVPVLTGADFTELLPRLQAKGFATYAAHLRGTKYHTELSFTGPTAFVIGNEGNGLTSEVADLCGSYLRIPMEGQVESLNAAISATLLMYEAHRQRHQ